MADIQELNQAPSTLNLYLKAAFKRKPRISGQVLPQTQVRLNAARARRSELSAYRRLCGFDKTGTLPLTYPHILAFPRTCSWWSTPSFLSLYRGWFIYVTQSASTVPSETEKRWTSPATCRGLARPSADSNLTFVTRVTVNDQPVWGSSTNLYRTATSTWLKKSATSTDATPETQSETWTLPENLGIRYAKVSGTPTQSTCMPVWPNCFGFSRHHPRHVEQGPCNGPPDRGTAHWTDTGRSEFSNYP